MSGHRVRPSQVPTLVIAKRCHEPRLINLVAPASFTLILQSGRILAQGNGARELTRSITAQPI